MVYPESEHKEQAKPTDKRETIKRSQFTRQPDCRENWSQSKSKSIVNSEIESKNTPLTTSKSETRQTHHRQEKVRVRRDHLRLENENSKNSALLD